MPSYTLGLIFSVPDGEASEAFMTAIQELIDSADADTSVDAATVTAEDGTVTDMLVETDIAPAREHQTSVYVEEPEEPNEETAQNAVPTNKEM